MAQSGQRGRNSRPSSHDLLWWFLLIPLLFIVLAFGLFLILFHREHFSYLLGVAAFSRAYAIHYFAVSVALCGVYIREHDEQKYGRLRDIEYRIVTSAMCVLAGGLGIVLAAGLCAIKCNLALCVYLAAAILLFVSVLKYVLGERAWWPREARNIVNGSQPSAEQGAPPNKQ